MERLFCGDVLLDTDCCSGDLSEEPLHVGLYSQEESLLKREDFDIRISLEEGELLHTFASVATDNGGTLSIVTSS